MAREGAQYYNSDKANLSRRSVDWRDSGIVIDDDHQFNSFDVICADFASSASGKSCADLATNNSSFSISSSLDNQDDDGDTILHLAVVGFTTDKVKDLIKICDLNAINNMIQTPMHVATMANRPEMVDLLLAASAKHDVHDRRGNTPLHLACQKNHSDIVWILLNYVKSHHRTQEEPDATSAVINAPTKTGTTTNSLKRYIEMTNFEGQTCLHLAATHNWQNVIAMLVQNFDANLNCKDSRSGDTILHKAISGFNVELVKFILQLEKHCNDTDFNGRSPSDTIKLLRESRLDSKQLEKLLIIEQLVNERIKQCSAQGGCCASSLGNKNRINCEILDPSSSSSDYSDSDSDMN